jgi:hypothetical protein
LARHEKKSGDMTKSEWNQLKTDYCGLVSASGAAEIDAFFGVPGAVAEKARCESAMEKIRARIKSKRVAWFF